MKLWFFVKLFTLFILISSTCICILFYGLSGFSEFKEYINWVMMATWWIIFTQLLFWMNNKLFVNFWLFGFLLFLWLWGGLYWLIEELHIFRPVYYIFNDLIHDIWFQVGLTDVKKTVLGLYGLLWFGGFLYIISLFWYFSFKSKCRLSKKILHQNNSIFVYYLLFLLALWSYSCLFFNTPIQVEWLERKFFITKSEDVKKKYNIKNILNKFNDLQKEWWVLKEDMLKAKLLAQCTFFDPKMKDESIIKKCDENDKEFLVIEVNKKYKYNRGLTTYIKNVGKFIGEVNKKGLLYEDVNGSDISYDIIYQGAQIQFYNAFYYFHNEQQTKAVDIILNNYLFWKKLLHADTWLKGLFVWKTIIQDSLRQLGYINYNYRLRGYMKRRIIIALNNESFDVDIAFKNSMKQEYKHALKHLMNTTTIFPNNTFNNVYPQKMSLFFNRKHTQSFLENIYYTLSDRKKYTIAQFNSRYKLNKYYLNPLRWNYIGKKIVLNSFRLFEEEAKELWNLEKLQQKLIRKFK